MTSPDDLDALALRLRLTRSEQAIFGLLLARAVVSREAALATLYVARPGDPAKPKIVDVFVGRIRRKLQPHGLAIVTVARSGWSLSADAKARARALLEVGAAP